MDEQFEYNEFRTPAYEKRLIDQGHLEKKIAAVILEHADFGWEEYAVPTIETEFDGKQRAIIHLRRVAKEQTYRTR